MATPACITNADDPPPSAAAFDSTVARDWFELMYGLVKSNGTNPPRAARIYGYCGIALFESVVHGIDGGQSLAGQLNGLAALPEPTGGEHHWPSVANAAMADMAVSFYPGSAVAIAALEDARSLDFSADASEDVIDRSRDYGAALAAAILAYAGTDGIAGVAACNTAFVPPLLPANGGWTGTGNGAEPCWGTMRTFVVADSAECPAAGAPAYSEDEDSAFYAQALLVYNTTGDSGASLTADQTAIANYWADGATTTGTPPGHWIGIVGVIIAQEGLMLDRSAEAYARVGIAVHDAFVTCWETKYQDYLKRPITYIQDLIDDEWTPLITTPNFPTYSSGHSTQSGAAATVLTDMFGPLAFTDTTHTDLDPELAFTDRSFATFLDAANEAANSRLYGGIHYEFDNEDGFDQGACVGSVINSSVVFRQ